jgi:hypothetical protein
MVSKFLQISLVKNSCHSEKVRACLHFGFAGENGQLKVLIKRFLSRIRPAMVREKKAIRVLLMSVCSAKDKFNML